ncbi:MAG: B12-binding domain-containing protein [Actinomycetota bacterium]
MSGPSSLTLAQAAEEVGVHYQTAYRWVRSGRLTATMVDGAYRVAREDLAALQADRRRPVAPPTPTRVRLDRQREALHAALLAGDEKKATGIVRLLATNGTSVVDLIDEVLAPPMADIGAAWLRGEATIYVEHRATAIVHRLLGVIMPNPRGRRRGTAVVAGLSGDTHHLPTTMATAVLREDNWAVEHLGADMPLAEIDGFLRAHPAELVVLSATGNEAGERAAEAKARLEAEHGIPVLVGGNGATAADLVALARQARAGGA